MYWAYFKYIVEHKWNVGIECIKTGQFIHAITHDLSKFRPSEFIPYAKFFFGTNRSKRHSYTNFDNADFQKGWGFHQKRNKHHWHYWVSITQKDKILPIPMPHKYVRQMIADWKGVSRKFGDTATKYYRKNKDKMILHVDTKFRINYHLL